jgi:hypothetical protein
MYSNWKRDKPEELDSEGSTPFMCTNRRERSHGWRGRQTVRVRVLTPAGASRLVTRSSWDVGLEAAII